MANLTERQDRAKRLLAMALKAREVGHAMADEIEALANAALCHAGEADRECRAEVLVAQK